MSVKRDEGQINDAMKNSPAVLERSPSLFESDDFFPGQVGHPFVEILDGELLKLLIFDVLALSSDQASGVTPSDTAVGRAQLGL